MTKPLVSYVHTFLPRKKELSKCLFVGVLYYKFKTLDSKKKKKKTKAKQNNNNKTTTTHTKNKQTTRQANTQMAHIQVHK